MKTLKKINTLTTNYYFKITNCLLLFAFCFLLTSTANAQTPITIKAAIDTALKNNLQIKNEKLQSEYFQKLKNASYNLPLTNVAFDYGNLNSAYSDNKFSISQSIKFPTVYAHQKLLIAEEISAANIGVTLKESEIKREVTKAFYSYLYVRKKQQLLLQADSIFTQFLLLANTRFNAGESNILERTTAETQLGQVHQQLVQLKNDEEIILLQFKFLLNTISTIIPFETNFKIKQENLIDTSVITKHPYLKLLQQQLKISSEKLALEKSKIAPDLFAAYNNGTFKGIGADNQLYTVSNRFQSFQIGVGLPLFYGSLKAQTNASKINLLMAKNNYLSGYQTLKTEYLQALQEQNKNLQQVEYYEISALKNAEIIIESSNAQFKNGNINYLEWVMLMNNAIAIKSEYVDAINNLNNSVINTNWITNK